MTLKQDITQTKNKLIAEVRDNGLYENFGQNEVRVLTGKHIDLSSYTSEMNHARALLQEFNEWCMTYSA